MNRRSWTSWDGPLAPAVLAAVVAALYLGTVPSGFLSDDWYFFHRLETEGLFTSWRGSAGFPAFRPATVLSLRMDTMLPGSTPEAGHLVSLALHWLCAWGVMHLTRLLLDRPGNGFHRGLPFATGLFFAVMASHSEPVVWISARSDLLATLFSLAAAVSFIRYGNGPSTRRAVLTPLFLVLALLSKESAAALPGMLAVIWLTRRTLPGLRLLAVCVLVPVAAAGAAVLLNPDFLLKYCLSRPETPFWENILRIPPRVFTGPLPPGPARWIAENPWIAGPAALLAACAAAAGLRRESRIPTLAGAGSFLMASIPAAWFPVGILDTQGERFLYLPGAFACVALAGVFRGLFGPGSKASWAMVAAASLQVPALCASLDNWRAAGRITEAVLSGLSASPPDDALVLNLPDNLRGAYIFRSGFDQAAEMTAGSPPGAYRVLMRYSLPSEDSLAMDSAGVTLRFTGEPVSFDCRGLQAELSPGELKLGGYLGTVLFYSDGGLRELPPPAGIMPRPVSPPPGWRTPRTAPSP
jgi:hypothetical protein